MVSNPAFAQFSQDEDNRVWNVRVEGNVTFEDMVIKNVISNEAPSLLNKLKFWKRVGININENEIRRDVIRIERFYQRRGFNDVTVNYRIVDQNKEWRKAVIFEIVENAPIRITSVRNRIVASKKDSIVVSNDENFTRVMRQLPYRENQRYQPIVRQEAIGNIVDALKHLGYAYASTEISASVDTAKKTAEVDIINYPGPRTRFDSVIVEGESTLAKKYIVRETGIQKGELYSEADLRDAQREVFNHHLLRFAIVSIPEQEIDTTLNILIRVKETPLREVQLKFGVGNLTRIDGWGDSYKLFRGQASWAHRNVRGKGERFSISGNASAIEQRLGADYLFPYLFNTKSSIILSPFVQHKLEPSYEIVRGGITNSFVYQYSQRITGSISHEFSLNNELTQSSQTELPDSILSYNVSSLNFSGYYANSNMREGRRGFTAQPNLELSGLFGQATYSFQKAGIDIRKYSPLTDNIIFAKRVNLSAIYFVKQDSLPADIRVYNGGTNSVRGWNRLELGPKRPIFEEGEFDHFVPTGGRATFSFNAELRFQLNHIIRRLGIATFLDGGQVWRKIDTIQNNIQYGIGGGIRYQSPLGPIRVDLAYKLNPTDEDLRIYNGQNYGSAWDRWGLHFSIGQAF
ncbi:MAG: BamA/TamA family outer membrane protein [Balneolaceae bacterium]